MADGEIELLMTSARGVIARRDHPRLHSRLDYAIRRGDLVAVLPGVYTPAALAPRPDIRMRAAMLRHPDAVLLRTAAATVSYWPDLRVGEIELAVTTLPKPAPGFRFSRRHIPPELIRHRNGLRFTDPALTAVDLATFECADAIDVALRTRAATLDGMYAALRRTPNRGGNTERRRLLVDSRHEPWSAAERLAHRELRAARILGWQTNWPVIVAGLLYYIDIAFPALRLAVEIDGRLHEDKQDLFQSDRWRQNALVLSGWRVIRFTWEMVRDHPEVMLENIRRLLRP